MATRDEKINKIRMNLEEAEKKIETLTDEQLDTITGGDQLPHIYGLTPQFKIGERVKIDEKIEDFWERFFAICSGVGSTHCYGLIMSVEKKNGIWYYSGENQTQGGKFFDIDEKFISRV